MAPIYASDAQLVVCILGPEYPKRVWTKFESEQFKQRFKSGDVIPVVLKTATLGVFDAAFKIGHIGWDTDADFKSQVEKAGKALIAKITEKRRKKK